MSFDLLLELVPINFIDAAQRLNCQSPLCSCAILIIKQLSIKHNLTLCFDIHYYDISTTIQFSTEHICSVYVVYYSPCWQALINAVGNMSVLLSPLSVLIVHPLLSEK